MTSSEFKTWLQGFLEGCGDNLTTAQLNKIKNMLNKVIDIPSYYPTPVISQPPLWITPTTIPVRPLNGSEIIC